MTKEEILTEIRRTAAENGGSPLGGKTFAQQTGISNAEWFGKFWRNWGEAVSAAGFEPNARTARIDDDELLSRYCALARELGHAPTKGDLRIAKRSDGQLPAEKTLANRFGSLSGVRAAAWRFASKGGEFADVVPLLASIGETDNSLPRSATIGFVYMIKHGARPEYKIGKTSNPVRREGELRLQLPEAVKPVHYIATDDPAGIEAYWHARFAEKRKEGEWFALNSDDVGAFKKWKRIS